MHKSIKLITIAAMLIGDLPIFPDAIKAMEEPEYAGPEEKQPRGSL